MRSTINSYNLLNELEKEKVKYENLAVASWECTNYEDAGHWRAIAVGIAEAIALLKEYAADPHEDY